MYHLLLYKTFVLRALVTLLKEEGINITTVTAIDIEKILAKTDIEKLQRLSALKYTISPLICRNKEDQELVYKVFDKLDAKVAEEYIAPVVEDRDGADIKKEIRQEWQKLKSPYYFKKILFPVAIIAIVLLAFYFLWNKYISPPAPPQKKISIVVNPLQVIANDTVHFTAVLDSSINRRKITVDWKIGDSLIHNTFSTSRFFSKEQSIDVTAYLKNLKGAVIDSEYYVLRILCEKPPSVQIAENTAATLQSKTKSNQKQFAALFTNPSADSSKYTYQWYINDSAYSKEKVLHYSKRYQTIKLVVGCKLVHCSTDSLVDQIESVPAISSVVNGDGALQIKSVVNWPNILMSTLLLFILPCVLSFLIFYIIFAIRNYNPELKEQEPGTDGPYKIEFNSGDKNINTEADIRKLADVLRKRQVSDIYRLNLRKTIKSTILLGGIPQLAFTPLTKPQSYLVFIDKEKPDSHLVKLFEYLVRKLKKEEVNISVYEYFKEPLYLSNEKLNHDRIPLEKIAALYPDTTLFIFGDAKYFLFPLKGTVKNWVTRKLGNWPTKILITPYSKSDWDQKEKQLIESAFVVLPADLSSLPVIDKIITLQIDIPAQKRENIEGAYRSRFLNFQDFEVLKAYLGEGQILQWVCSTAVYPAIDWNLTLAFGKAIEQQWAERGMKTDLVNYTNLLKIGRISWMQDGIINESLRAQMLSYLDKDAEALARKTVSEQLQLINDTISNTSLVKSGFDVHQKLNQFLLDSYQHHKISREDEAFVKKMLETNQLDEGQDIYLNNSNNSMVAHPFKKDKEVGLSRYFTLKTYREILLSSGFAAPVLLVLILLSYNLLKNNTGYLNWASKKAVDQTYIVNSNGNTPQQQLSISLFYEPGRAKFRSINTRLANASDTFQFNAVPVADTMSYGVLGIGTIDGKPLRRDSFKLNSNVYRINIGEVPKIPLSIFYNNETAVALANTIQENLPSNFSINMQQQNFSDTSMARIYYFSATHKNDALLAASTVGALVSRSIQPLQVDSAGFPKLQANIVIYINQQQPCTPVTLAALPKSLSEIWHGGTSNRLLNINLDKRVMYYSVNNTKTYGTYGMDDICLTPSGVYKIITRTGSGYKLFFIKNIKQQSFELSVCQDFAKTKEELQSRDETYCDKFNAMTLYYENDASRIYLPVGTANLVPGQKRKLDDVQSTINRMNNQKGFNYDIVLYQSGTFIKQITNPAIGQYLSNSKIAYPASRNNAPTNLSVTALSAPNPFQRNYMVINMKNPANNPPENNIQQKAPDIPNQVQQTQVKADCSKTFYSIDEVIKLLSPLIVCRLDLSKSNLSSLPKEIYALRNLQWLNLGTTNIPQADIDQLKKELPKCEVIYIYDSPKKKASSGKS